MTRRIVDRIDVDEEEEEEEEFPCVSGRLVE